MARSNVRSTFISTFPTVDRRTANGALAATISPYEQLRRMTLTALLWEKQFYTKGDSHAAQVAALVPQCTPTEVANLARECRNDMYLRHMPLFLVRELARHPNLKACGGGALVAEVLSDVIQRADELGEFVSLYWRDKKEPLSAGVKRGLAHAFAKFNAYALAKYNGGKAAVKLRDVLRLVHPKPMNKEQSDLWKMVKDDTLPTPDTWEVALSAAKGPKAKREVWERLLTEKKLGGLAFLRNLRNMVDVGVDRSSIFYRFGGDFKKILPFRFLAAVKHAPEFATHLEEAMLRSAQELPKLSGRTILLIDVSGSMDAALSGKSDLLRLEAACAMAMLLREVSPDVRIFTFSSTTVEIPDHRGFNLNNAIIHSQSHLGTELGRAIQTVNPLSAERLIVLTDEQTSDRVDRANFPLSYIINVGADKNGVGYGQNGYVHVDGFSERIVDYIAAYEQSLSKVIWY